MVLDLAFGLAAVAIAAGLLHFSEALARQLQVADDRWRERMPWVQAFEPQAGYLATDGGRRLILRSWVVAGGLGYALVGALLVLRAVG